MIPHVAFTALVVVAVPIVHELTLVADRSEHSVLPKLLSSGEMLTNMSLLLFPPSEFWSKYVSFELRYEMCVSLLAIA